MLLCNGLVVDTWNGDGGAGPTVGPANVRVRDGLVVEVGADLTPAEGEDVVDAAGGVIAPGFVCGHTHLYSVLSRGMPATDPVPPRNFLEILQKVWWKLDKALDRDSVIASARIGIIEALACGTTGLIDHHASPTAIDGSLDCIAEACRDLGVRGLLCYETSDRDGAAATTAGIAENRRFSELAQRHGDGMVGAMVGIHAPFTVSDQTLDQLGQVCADTGTGVHIHVAEGTTDRALTRQRYGRDLLQPLAQRGLLGAKSILAHCVDLRTDEMDQLIDSNTSVAHNPSSNMNNRVGISPLWAQTDGALLGTDGIGADMYREAKSAWFRGMEADPSCSPGAILGMLQNNASVLGRHLGVGLGRIAVGMAADLQILRYRTPTRLSADNLGGHFLFGMSAAHVETTIVAGKVRWHRGTLPGLDIEREYAIAAEQADALWKRMAS